MCVCVCVCVFVCVCLFVCGCVSVCEKMNTCEFVCIFVGARVCCVCLKILSTRTVFGGDGVLSVALQHRFGRLRRRCWSGDLAPYQAPRVRQFLPREGAQQTHPE